MTERLRNQLGDWGDVLSPFISNPSFDHVRTQLRVEKSKTIVYPSDDKIFKAFELCQFKDLKVVILGFLISRQRIIGSILLKLNG